VGIIRPGNEIGCKSGPGFVRNHACARALRKDVMHRRCDESEMQSMKVATKERFNGQTRVIVHFHSASSMSFSSFSFETSITGIDIRLAVASVASEIGSVALSSLS
jgi:hypothetical protein